MRGFWLPLTPQQVADLKFVLAYEIAVPKAVNAKLKAWGGKGLSQDEMERLSLSLSTIWEKVAEALH